MHLLLGINPSAPVAPASLVPLITAGYTLPLATNVLVTVLIVLRIWYLSPARNPQLRGISTRSRTARRAIDIMVESGALYMVTQIIFVVLFAVRHPAQAIIAVVAVQIYVSFFRLFSSIRSEPGTGHCAYSHHNPRYLWHPRCLLYPEGHWYVMGLSAACSNRLFLQYNHRHHSPCQ